MAKLTYHRETFIIDVEIADDERAVNNTGELFNIGNNVESVMKIADVTMRFRKDPEQNAAVFLLREMRDGNIPSGVLMSLIYTGFVAPMRLAEEATVRKLFG